MHFLLNPVGSLGDVNPFLGIGRELTRRGHSVVVLANPLFEPAVENAGLGFQPVGTAADLEAFWRSPEMWDVKRFWKKALIYSALRPMRSTYEAILKRYVPGETVLAAPAWSFGARIARETHRIPLATIHLEPYLLRSTLETARMPAPMVMESWVPRHWKRLQFWIADRFFIDPVIAPETNAFRRSLGLAPVARLSQAWWHSPDLVLGMFPAWFCAPQRDWPAATELFDLSLCDGTTPRPLPDDAEAFLRDGSPPVAFTPGTANRHAARFFAAAAEACRLAGRRGLLLTKNVEQLPQSLPDGVRTFPYLPFRALLPRCSALVHHGGTGTTALGLSAGLPHVVTPMSFSQPDVARRLERLDVGRELPLGRLSGATLARRIIEVTMSPDVARACRLSARRMARDDVDARVADRLERLLSAQVAPSHSAVA